MSISDARCRPFADGLVGEFRLNAVRVCDLRRPAARRGGVDGRDMGKRVGDAGERPARIAVGGFRGHVRAGKLRGQKLAGAVVGIGPGARLAVGGVGDALAGRVGQRVGQEIAARTVGETLIQAVAGNRVLQMRPPEIIGDVGDLLVGRVRDEADLGRQAVAVVDPDVLLPFQSVRLLR